MGQNPSLATAAKLAIQINKRPSKRVSTSLCTLVAQLALNGLHSHRHCEKTKRGRGEKRSCCTTTAAAAVWTFSTQLVDKLAPAASCVPTKR